MSTLICKLVKSVVTDDGDYIAKGTPCEVLCWSSGEDLERVTEQSRIDVRVKAYMYADDLGSDNYGPKPVIGKGLVIAVGPDDLEYSTSGIC